MKTKSVLSAAIISCLSILSLGAQTQTKTSFGVKLNGNLTNVKLTDLPGSKSSFHPGASLGGFAKIEFNEHFALQPELMFNYTESNVKFAGEKLKFKYAGVEIPVYALGQYKTDKGTFFGGVGPHIGYGFSIDARVEDIPSGWPGDNKIEMDHWYAGGNVMIGYEFPVPVSIHLGYQLSFDFSSKNRVSDVNSQTISLGVGYRF